MTSLVPTGRMRGVSKEELIRHVAEPGYDPNQFEATLEAFRRYGSYFHREEERFISTSKKMKKQKLSWRHFGRGAMRPRDSKSAKSGLGIFSKNRNKQ